MTGDPIIDEVRRVREGLARQADYKVDQIFATLREGEARPDPDHPLAEAADRHEYPTVVREESGNS